MEEVKIEREGNECNFENAELDATLRKQGGASKDAIGNSALEGTEKVWIGCS